MREDRVCGGQYPDSRSRLITVGNKFITIAVLDNFRWIVVGRWHFYPVYGGNIFRHVLFLSVLFKVSCIPSVEVAEDDQEQGNTGNHPEGYFEPSRFGFGV